MLAQEQILGLPMHSCNVSNGLELITLHDMPFDAVARDDNVSSWASVSRYSRFMGTYVQSRRQNISLTKGMPVSMAHFNPFPRRNAL